MTPPVPYSTAQLEALAKLCDAATPGPWRAGNVEHDAIFIANDTPDAMGPERVLMRLNRYYPRNHADDSAFIAASRDAMQKLIAELRAANATLEKIRAANAECTGLDDFNDRVCAALMEHGEDV